MSTLASDVGLLALFCLLLVVLLKLFGIELGL